MWDIKEEVKKTFNGTLNKDDLIFKLMIRQPYFVNEEFWQLILKNMKAKKPHELLDRVKFEEIEEGKCVQMLHLGSYDDEPASFSIMEEFARINGLKRLSKIHREIYLTDARKTAFEKLKTVLLFNVE